MTVEDIITAAYQELSIIPSGATPNLGDQAWGLSKLNRLLKSLSIKGMILPATITENFSLTAGKEKYTIGIGMDFDTIRPTRIEQSFIRIDSSDYDVTVEPPEDYWKIDQKDVSGQPIHLYYSPDFADYGTIRVYYTPDTTYNLYLVSEKPFDTYADVTADSVIRPAYEDYIITKLAISFAPRFGKQIPASLARHELILDSDLLGNELARKHYGKRLVGLPGQAGFYNIDTDEVE